MTIADDNDFSAMKYYISRVDSVMASNYLFNNDSKFSFSLESEYFRTNYRGEVDRSDTASLQVLFGNKKLIESEVLDSAKEDGNSPPDDFIIPALWNDSCSYFFYPNDTGAGDLSIGFEFENIYKNGLVSGLITFNRNSYLIKTLILYYIDTGNTDHMSKVFKFIEQNTRPVLNEVEIHWKKGTLLGREYYLIRYRLFDYELH